MKNFKLFFSFLFFGVLFLSGFSYGGNPFVWNLLGTQLEIGLSQRSSIGISKSGNEMNSLAVYYETFSGNQYDLISELDKAKSEQERLQIINQYIALLSNSVSNGSDMYSYEQSQVNYFNAAVKECKDPIKAKNSEFSDAVKSYDYERAESISKEIAELRACMARNEVYAKAHASYASTAKSLDSLQKRIDYLSENKEKIAKYYEILKPDLLKELYDISKTVESNF